MHYGVHCPEVYPECTAVLDIARWCLHKDTNPHTEPSRTGFNDQIRRALAAFVLRFPLRYGLPHT